MSLIDYISESWALLLIVVAMAIMTLTTVHMTKRMTFNTFVILGLTVLLSVVDYTETYFGNNAGYENWRTVLTALKYIISPLMLSQIIITLFDTHRWYIIVPAFVNVAACLASIFTKWVYYIDSENSFHRGPLGYLPFIICFIYLGYIVFLLIKSSNRQPEDILPIAFLAGATLLVIVLPIIWGEKFYRWFCTTVAICVFVNYVFMLQQLTKKDALTGLLNRQSYYAEMQRSASDITALVSLDMNGLKAMNDKEGHLAGDRALTTLAGCFSGAAHFGQWVYRIGGDEFMIICERGKKEDVEKLVARIRHAVDRTNLSCCIGWCYREKGMSLDEVFRLADERMYEEKREYYLTHERGA